MEVRERSLQSETRLKHAGRGGGASPPGIAAHDVWHPVSRFRSYCALARYPSRVMAGLVPAIHAFAHPLTELPEGDARNESGHDGVKEWGRREHATNQRHGNFWNGTLEQYPTLPDHVGPNVTHLSLSLSPLKGGEGTQAAPTFSPSPPLGAERAGVRWGMPGPHGIRVRDRSAKRHDSIRSDSALARMSHHGHGLHSALRALWLVFAGLLVCVWAGPAAAERVVVFAAASTAHVIDEVIGQFEAGPDDRVVASYAGTAALARQIESGAPADIFLAANAAWMDHVEALGLIEPESRQTLAGNRLVFVTGDGSIAPFEPSASLDLGALLAGGRLAIGNPDHVPAGIYARQALEALGLWPRRERPPRAGSRRAGGARARGQGRGTARHRLRDRCHPHRRRACRGNDTRFAARADRLPGCSYRGPRVIARRALLRFPDRAGRQGGIRPRRLRRRVRPWR